MSIFKEYDIRGVHPSELDEEMAYRIGHSIARYLKSKKLVVGMDGRLSSPSLARALINGILDEGIDVVDIGLASTPMFYHALVRLNLKGVMVTASHNPKQYNGFKIVKEDSMQLTYQQGIKQIEKIFLKDKFEIKKQGQLIKKDILKEYSDYLCNKFSADDYSKLKIVIDFSNGVGALPKNVFDRLKIKNTKLGEKIDGNFPRHPCNPLISENVADLQKAVKKQKADAGIIFDGDADRVIFVDEKGGIISSDLAFVLLAREALKHSKDKKCYYDLRFSKIVWDEIKKAGGKPVMMRVGNPFYKKALLLEGGVLAMELSGHIMYKDNYNIDDALYASLKMLTIVAKENKKFSELVAPLKRYHQTDEINIEVKNKKEVLKKIEKKYRDCKIFKLDGISAYGKGFWFNIRESQTEPLLRMRVEADSRQLMNLIVKEILKEAR
jgi:phosphomannomutase